MCVCVCVCVCVRASRLSLQLGSEAPSPRGTVVWLMAAAFTPSASLWESKMAACFHGDNRRPPPPPRRWMEILPFFPRETGKRERKRGRSHFFFWVTFYGEQEVPFPLLEVIYFAVTCSANNNSSGVSPRSSAKAQVTTAGRQIRISDLEQPHKRNQTSNNKHIVACIWASKSCLVTSFHWLCLQPRRVWNPLCASVWNHSHEKFVCLDRGQIYVTDFGW